MSTGLSVALVAGAYLLGSISWSVLLVRLLQGMDVRSVGSGNAGATNVMRTAGKKAGTAVLVLDIGRGRGWTGPRPRWHRRPLGPAHRSAT